MRTLLDEIVVAVAPLLDCPFAFFGHSLGAIVAYEVALALERGAGLGPVLLIPSGHRAPHLPPTRPPIAHLPDEAFLAELILLNGMAPELLENRELVELLLPAVRADLGLAEAYEATEGQRLHSPLLALGAENDAYVSADAIAAWRGVTEGPFASQIFPGDHFYLNTSRSELLTTIAAAIDRQLPALAKS